MARLNEPPMSTDNIETLRRKFLRQNRDIARVNSNQSLRIRSLEGECGRLMSDNLTLNSRILELEKEVAEYRGAQRIADHALQIKAKMEAQLMEWGVMIQGLGIEPSAKRHDSHSPGGSITTRMRLSAGPSPRAPMRRPRTAKTAEAVAAQEEGRLPPIQENKSYPRRTMSQSELVAICTEAQEINDSPDLGPPPTSRFVEDDPVKIDSPSRSTGTLLPSPKIKGEVLPLPDAIQQPRLQPKKRPISATNDYQTDDPKAAKTPDITARQVLNAGSKRKFGNENSDAQIAKIFAEKDRAGARAFSEKPLIGKEHKLGRNGKDVNSTKNGLGKVFVDMQPRKPLGEKSRNDDLVSPKKLAQAAKPGDIKKPLAEPNRTVAPLKKKRVVPIKLGIPSLPPPSEVKLPREPATPSADLEQIFSNTPEASSAQELPRDTPPPTDISVYGETSRPSRRARPSISYAEPSLRDKMRRPTKELFDAVHGEGKYVRASSANLLSSQGLTKPKSEDSSSSAVSLNKTQDMEANMAHEAARRPSVASPLLLQKDSSKEQKKAVLPESVVTSRRKRPSSRPSQVFESREDDEATETKQHEVDPYEFHSISPATEQPEKPTLVGRITKGMTRSMAASTGQSSDEARGGKKAKSKRASMAAPKKGMLLESPMDDEDSYEASGDSTKDTSLSLRDKLARRKSMMV